MDSKLNNDEISALQSLDPDHASDGASFRDGDLPHRLFAFNLVTRQPSGKAMLTKAGERALFREACIAALSVLAAGETPVLASGVRRWLASSGFVVDDHATRMPPAITPRGKLWLQSFTEDALVAIPELTAADFESRRA